MNKRNTLHIPQPCMELWQEMDVTQQGRFCHKCSSEVIDFTQMSVAQLQRYFEQNTGKVCGRLTAVQLAAFNSTVETPVNRQFFSGYKLLLASALTLFLDTSANSQVVVPKKTTAVYASAKSSANSKKDKFSEPGVFVVEGIVKDEIDELPLLQASVTVLHTRQCIATDENGKFKLLIKGRLGQKVKLQIKYLGYDVKIAEVVLGQNKMVTVQLQSIPFLLGEVVIAAPTVSGCNTVVGKLVYTQPSQATDSASVKIPFFKRLIQKVEHWLN